MLITNTGAFIDLLNPVGIPHIAHTHTHVQALNQCQQCNNAESESEMLDQSIQFLSFAA